MSRSLAHQPAPPRLRTQSSPVNITISAQSGTAPTSWKRARHGAPETAARMCHGPHRRVLAHPAHLARRRHWRCTAADDIHPQSLACRLLSHSDPPLLRLFFPPSFLGLLPSTLFHFHFLLQCSGAGGPAAFVPDPSGSSPRPFPPVMGSFMLQSGLRLPNNMSCCGFFPLSAVREPRNWSLTRCPKKLKPTR